MTTLLEKAIAHARALPPEDQDTLGAVLLAMTDEGAGLVPIDDEARAGPNDQLRRNATALPPHVAMSHTPLHRHSWVGK